MRALHVNRKNIKAIISFLLIISILLGGLPAFSTLLGQKVDAQTLDFTSPIEGTRIDGGTLANKEGVEDALTWEVTEYEKDYWVLTIAGEGGIPDFATSYNEELFAKRPWHKYQENKKIKQIAFGDGINYVGSFAFTNFYEETIDFGNSEAIEIASWAFNANWYLYNGKTMVIPGNVKKIAYQAFDYSIRPTAIILEEGVEELGQGALTFAGRTADQSAEYIVHLPSTVRSVVSHIDDYCGGYTVAEDNPYFKAVDGVLYSKDGSELVDYPPYKRAAEFRVPDDVRLIRSEVFSHACNTKKLYIPSTVEEMEFGFASMGYSNFEEVYIEDGIVFDPYALFFQAKAIRKIRYPDTAYFKNGMYSIQYPTSTLESFNVPAKATINVLTDSKVVSEIYYEAIDGFKSSNANGNILPAECRFTLTLAKTVDVLRWNFYELSQKAETILFEGPNYINIISTEGKTEPFAYAPKPLTNLNGTIYVDEQGVVYSYDVDSATAKLVYVPSGLTNVTIPATITAEDGSTVCTVTTVGENSLLQAEGLQSITFANPANITILGGYGLGNCPTITLVNGQTTVEEATAIFTNAEIGYQPFYNTGLTGAKGAGAYEEGMDGQKHLTLSREDFTDLNLSFQSTDAVWQGEETAGGYRLLTGASLGINATVGSTGGSDRFVYRVYYRMRGNGDLSAVPGRTYDFDNGLTATCYATEAPDTVYMEFTPPIGDTNTVFVSAAFPNFTSSGGEITVWGSLLTKEEAEEKQNLIIEPADGQTLQAYWTTVEDTFGVTKTTNGTEPQLVGDGQGGAMPDKDIVWTIDFARSDDESYSLGKDLIRSVDYTDVLTFPAGINWSSQVIEAAKDGSAVMINGSIYADDEKVLSLTCSGGTISGARLIWDEQKQNVVLHWSVHNTSRTVELAASALTLTIHPKALKVDMSAYNRETENVLENTVNATVHYTFAEDALLQASATRSMGTGEGKLQLTKVGDLPTNPIPHMGEDITYTVQLSNIGALPYVATDGVYQMVDELNSNGYIKPENLQRMFEEDPNLTVTITNAMLQPWVQKTGVDGNVAWQYAGNHSTSTNTTTLTLTKVDGGYQVTVKNGTVFTASTVAQVLKDAGFSTTRKTQYTCTWPLNEAGENFEVNNGQPITRMIYATFKDSFNSRYYDSANTHNSNNLIGNTAILKNPAGKNVIDCVRYYEARYEAFLYNNVYKNGVELEDLSGVKQGDVLDYTTTFTHYGTGEYENLPIIQDIYGSQYLLVSKEQNPDLADKGLREHGDCYVLTDGTYTNVVVGQTGSGQYLIADSITVGTNTGEEIFVNEDPVAMTGVYTRVEWFFPELPGEEYQIDISYQTLVDISMNEDITFSLGNYAWANDTTIPDAGESRGVGRLYDTFFGSGSFVVNDKHIVTVKGETPDQDLLEEELPVEIGQQVLYRLDLHTYSDYDSVTIRGDNLADMLPYTYGAFTWEKGVNVTDLRIEGTEGVTSTGIEDWYIGDSYNGNDPITSGYILWPETTSITIPGGQTAYIYVTLTFPENDENGVWERYVEENAGLTLRNTFYCHHLNKTVTHLLKESGKVLLQKGVVGMYYQKAYFQSIGNSRLYYNNQDFLNRKVVYYVVVSNQGNKRLHLNDLVDELPKGFTFDGMLNNGNITGNYKCYSSITTPEGYEAYGEYPLFDAPDSLYYKSAVVNATKTEEGVNFSFSGGELSYDETEGMYYLNKNEAIAFPYVCSIGTTDQTEVYACNTVKMKYHDSMDSGVTMVDDKEFPVTAPNFDVFVDANDGERNIIDDGEGNQWLTSAVTVERGNIIPGVTKEVTGYTNTSTGTVVNTAPSSITPDPNNLIHWKVNLHNNGTRSITDYTVTDIMPKPYIFEGDVTLVIYNGQGENRQEMSRKILFTIPDRTGDESVITITTGFGHNQLLYVDSSKTTSLDSDYALVSLYKDKNGNEAMKLVLKDKYYSIPELGCAELIFSSRNPTTESKNAVYTNVATLTPNAQSFEKVGQGTMIRENGTPVSVSNWAPLTVAYGFSTTSQKKVTEKVNPSNTATSKSDQTIWLENEEGLITYDLEVTNSTPKAMTKLVLIDNLPQIGDVSPFDTNISRGSEYQVDLAENPNFKVTVTPKDTETYELNSSNYTIEYATTYDFGGPQSADWKGETSGTTATWTTDPTGARAVRLIIQDDSATKIPAGAVVNFSFDAKKTGDALPGQKAWNSFGYHYAIEGATQELEAMPLPVAVAIPNDVKLVKELVTPDGSLATADTDLTFSFTIKRDSTDETQTVTLTVPKGQSTSQTVSLVDILEWVKGERYTITEDTNMPFNYKFDHFDGSNSDSYSFVYDPADTPTVRCVNEKSCWSVKLTKVNNLGNTLPGAMFGIYSTNPNDLLELEDEKYNGVKVKTQIELDGITWYLKAVGETNEDGILHFDDLQLEQYWLQELKAPDGYYLDAQGQMLERPTGNTNVLQVTVENVMLENLPIIGGHGTKGFLLLGGLLFVGGAFFLLLKRRKNIVA